MKSCNGDEGVKADGVSSLHMAPRAFVSPLAIACGPLFPGPCSTTSRVPACSLVLQGFQPLTEMPDGGLTMEREYSYTEQHNMHSVLFFMMDYDKNGASEPLPPSGPMYPLQS